jgi:hypothetical protein
MSEKFVSKSVDEKGGGFDVCVPLTTSRSTSNLQLFSSDNIRHI